MLNIRLIDKNIENELGARRLNNNNNNMAFAKPKFYSENSKKSKNSDEI